MSQILGVKFSDYGPLCYFASGAFVVSEGQSVLVETDQGLALGRVTAVCAPGGSNASDSSESARAEVGPACFAAGMESPAWDGSEPDAETAAPAEASAETPAEAAAPAEDERPAGGTRSAPTARTGAAALFSCDQAAQPAPRPESVEGLACVYRVATEADLEAHAENLRLARRAFTFCREAIAELKLDMKLVDVETLHDRSKMIFFFTAPSRIDFRELIKSLVREFHTRIELRQIGVRHETQMIGALGNCGQVCCCRRFLRKFAPVTIKMAKEQNLFLNPAKISGICGRLLCCLSYEQKGYEEFHKQCPKIGKRVATPLGSAKVLRANFFKKTISVWLEDFGEREYTLDEWRDFLSRPPEEAQAAEAAKQSQATARSGRMRGGGRLSASRPAKRERPPRSEGQAAPPSAAPEKDLTEGQASDAAASAANAERRKPRRKRRKGRGTPTAG